MFNPKILKAVTTAISILKPFAFAVVGGLVVLKCEKHEPVQLTVTNQNYENQLQDIRLKQDVLSGSLPSIDSSLRYLSRRYPEGNAGSINR